MNEIPADQLLGASAQAGETDGEVRVYLNTSADRYAGTIGNRPNGYANVITEVVERSAEAAQYADAPVSSGR